MRVNSPLISEPLPSRWHFASSYALRHLGFSIAVALLSAALVFGLLYPAPYRAMLGVGPIFALLLLVDVVCGPLLTFVLATPRKSLRERWLDFGLVGMIQILALTYGLHSVWVARPVVLAFEKDRLVVVTANEIEPKELRKAPDGLKRLPWWGLMQVGTREPRRGEFLESIEQGLAGYSPAKRPGWWVPWYQQIADMSARTKPLSELISKRSQDAEVLLGAVKQNNPVNLRYLPFTSSKVKEWVVIFDADLKIVGYAPVDGF